MNAKEIKHTFLQSAGNLIVPALADALARSLKIEIENPEVLENLKKEKRNFVAAFWHGKMFAGWYVFGGENSAALVSKSKDGEILARALKKWGYEVIRGSSHIGGKEALQLMENALAKGYSISITPDGPTGPREKMKAGAVVLAKKTGVPVVLAGICYEKKRTFNSWDRFELPKLFSHVRVVLSKPFYVSTNLTYEETDMLIREKEKELIELNEKASKNC